MDGGGESEYGIRAAQHSAYIMDYDISFVIKIQSVMCIGTSPHFFNYRMPTIPLSTFMIPIHFLLSTMVMEVGI